MDPATRVGAVRLAVADLARSVAFYEVRIGLKVRERGAGEARLGASGGTRDLLVLVEKPGARPARRATGLYHVAILLPTRADLSRALARLMATRTPLTGAADHGVSEALYLDDAEGNGIEIYRDRPREDWPWSGDQLEMGGDRLALQTLLDEAGGVTDAAAPAATTVGHVHLHVAHLAAAESFYAGALGLRVTQRMGPSALFLAAGDYHHHVAVNTWKGEGAPSPPENASGLVDFELRLPSRAEIARAGERLAAANVPFEALPDGAIATRDPSRNALRLVLA